MKFVIEAVGGVACRVELGAHTLVFDQPGSVPGGEDRGPSPLDAMVATIGACAHYFAAAFLQARKLPTDGLKVHVEADKVKEPWPRLGTIQLRVTLPHGVPERYLGQIERAILNCPAYGTLRHLPETSMIVELHLNGPV